MTTVLIYAKDLCKIPDFRNLSVRSLYRRYSSIRDFVGKERAQPLTYLDLATYLDLPEEKVREIMTETVRK